MKIKLFLTLPYANNTEKWAFLDRDHMGSIYFTGLFAKTIQKMLYFTIIQ